MSQSTLPQHWQACAGRPFIINETCGTIKSESQDFYLIQFDFGDFVSLKSKTYDQRGATYHKRD